MPGSTGQIIHTALHRLVREYLNHTCFLIPNQLAIIHGAMLSFIVSVGVFCENTSICFQKRTSKP